MNLFVLSFSGQTLMKDEEKLTKDAFVKRNYHSYALYFRNTKRQAILPDLSFF